MLQLKRNILCAALASAIMLGASAAHAQDAGQTGETDDAAQAEQKDEAVELDRVTVTGIRGAIEAAIDTKRSEDTIVEAISAEDIGKLPDSSIADSIARLPGITTQSYGGRPQEINIRGMAGDFSTGLLNGREQASTSNNRGVEFDQYPSELMSQVVVHKTTSAELVGQGLSGTVNMKTVRPLDYGEQAVAVNVRGDMNDLDGEHAYGNRFSVSYIDQFADDTVGIAVGYAHMDSPNQSRQYESWGYSTGYAGYEGDHVLGGGGLFLSDIENKRDGLMATIQFKPNDDFSSTLDLFYSEYERTENKRGLQYGLAYGSGSTLTDATLSENGTTIDSSWTGVAPTVVRNDYNQFEDKVFSLGWRNELNLNDNWKMATDVSYSRAVRNEMVLETYASPCGDTTDTITASNNSDGWVDIDTGIDYGDADGLCLQDPGGWGGDRAQAGYLKYFETKDTISAIRFDFSRSFQTGFISSLEFGANLTERSKTRASTEYTLCTTADCLGSENVEAAIPSQYVGDSSFGFGGIDSLLSLDALSMLNDGVYYLVAKEHSDINNKNWEVNERVATLYAQANLDADLGPVRLKGNVGVQLVNASQDSTGVATYDGAALDSSSGGASYSDYLPSMNLSFGLPAEQFVRFGAARQMARPRMDDMVASAVYSYNTSQDQWEGSGGNPQLKPWLANAYDLSYEKYFADGKGYVSAAYFFKDLKTYIYNQVVEYDFSQLPIDASTLTPEMTESWIGYYTQPVNGEGGLIKGYELAVSVPLDMLWTPLQGFGVIASYADTESEIHPNGPDTTEPLPGLSKYVSNVTLYYERYGFSARVSQRHRSQFLGEVQGLGGDLTQIMFAGETVLDLQLGYTFQSGPLKNLSLSLQVNNLENEPFRSIYDSLEERPNKYYEYGRTVLLGANYKF